MIELPAARVDDSTHPIDVAGIVRQGEVAYGRVPPLDVEQRVKQLDIVAERPRDGPQSAHVLRVTPTGVVSAAVRVRDEGDGHADWRVGNPTRGSSADGSSPTMGEQQDRSV